MQALQDAVDEAAESSRFSGVVRVDRSGVVELCTAYGLADRAHEVPNTVDTVFAIASGTKGLTALAVMGLVERGTLALGDVRDYVMTVPVHEFATTEQFLPALDGHPAVSPAGERFAYNNAGYVLLALLAERASGVDFHDLVRTLVCEPAGMVDTAFLRSDELPGRAARGYLSVDGLRTNVFHLPVLGNGDGGIYSTAADLHRFWEALGSGRIVSPATVELMTTPRSDWPEESRRYGLGLHLHARGDGVWLEGYDAGVSFASLHHPSSSITYTVISNWTDGAWPVVRL